MPFQNQSIESSNSEAVKDIITAVPSWILRWGITLVFSILLMVILMSALIRYPDIIRTSLRVSSLNSPKEIIARQNGKLVKLLAEENSSVHKGAPLAFLESTANHNDVIRLKGLLISLGKKIETGDLASLENQLPKNLSLGELQSSYQDFYQDFIQFANTEKGGFYLVQKQYLQNDLKEIGKLQQQILKRKEIQQKELTNIKEEYENYRILKNKDVISNSEFRQQENKYLAGKYPLEQTTSELINNNSTYLAKQKELAALDNTILEQRAKFIQSLQGMINATDQWLLNYVCTATVSGKVSYVGILQENQNVKNGQELFLINPGNSSFFGEVQVPQYNMGKVHLGQKVLVKMKSYPFEEFGIIEGKISYITDVALKDSVFFAKVDFKPLPSNDKSKNISLKPGMLADAEIVTRDNSLLNRFFNSLFKKFN
jgi:multidrug efflux pump subunit AcrA (membrane-fusion protein)